MVDNTSAGGSNRYRKLSGIGVSERLFSWGKIQSEIVSAENEYLEIAGTLSAANKNIEQLKREIAELTAKYTQAAEESARLSEKLAEETAAHELLKESYEANTKNWAEDEACKETTIHQQEETITSQKKQIARLEADLADAAGRSAELSQSLAQKETELAEKTERYTTLTTEYTALLHEKNGTLDRLAAAEETITRLNYTHAKEIDDLNADFEERSRLYVPTIHELTRTVDSWKYQRECDLTEIHRLKTTLDSREKEIVGLKQELSALKDVKKQMLTEINRMGFATVQADSEFRQKQEELKEEQAKLAKEINQLEQTKQSLQSDLSAKQQTLSTYSAITDEILEEWKKHGDKTLACIAEAAGTAPAVEKYGFLAQISGHHVLFAAFAPASYEELRGADGLVREVAKKLANTVDTVNCRKEAFVVVPDECMMYLTKCLYASPLCSVQVITPSQIVGAVRMVARFVIYEKTQVQ